MKCPNCNNDVIIKELNDKKYAVCDSCKKIYDLDKLIAIRSKKIMQNDTFQPSKIVISILASSLIIVIAVIAALLGTPAESSVSHTTEPKNKAETSSAKKTKSRKSTTDRSDAEVTAKDENIPKEFQSAVNSAANYSNIMHMSKTGIYNQLTSEYGDQFSAEAAQYAIDHINVDWNENALQKARDYCDMYMSKAGIYDQLISEYGEQFTPEEAQYAVDHVQANWNGNALQKAKTYQDEMNMSPAAIRDQLISEYGEQFTTEEADYAISNLH